MSGLRSTISETVKQPCALAVNSSRQSMAFVWIHEGSVDTFLQKEEGAGTSLAVMTFVCMICGFLLSSPQERTIGCIIIIPTLQTHL